MLQDLILERFRNHHDKAVELDPVTVIIGNNGAGKTNILEALFLLSLTTSWRTDRDLEVIQWGEPFCRVRSGNREMVIQRTPYLKRYKIAGVSKRTHEVMGSLPSVLFNPDDTLILSGAPNYRRRYLDHLLIQISPPYAQAVSVIAPVLRQRNKLLKQVGEGKAQEVELHFWDGELAKIQAVMQPAREQFVHFLNQRVPELFTELLPETPPLTCRYLKSPKQEGVEFIPYIQENRRKELAAGVTLYGPQREDLHFFWGEHSAQQSLSRGQSRSLLLSLKLAELEYLDQKLEERPFLLLDDVFSELDVARRTKLLTLLGKYQTVITAVEFPPEISRTREDCRVITLQ
jgi:DNA replication and repair protein RecF